MAMLTYNGFPMTSAKAHGALGDGTTDDTAAIQAAIDAAEENGTVYLPPGRYVITGSGLTANKSINIVGAGPAPWTDVADVFGGGGWTIDGTDHYQGAILLTSITSGAVLTVSGAAYSPRVNIEDVAIFGLGNNTRTTVGFVLGDVTRAVRATFRNVSVWNIKVGVRCDNAQDSHFDALELRGCGTGIHFDGDSNGNTLTAIEARACDVQALVETVNNSFVGGTIQGHKDYGIRILGGENNVVQGVYFESNDASALSISIEGASGSGGGAGGHHNLVQWCHFADVGDGISVWGDGNVLDLPTFVSVTFQAASVDNLLKGHGSGTYSDLGAHNQRERFVSGGHRTYFTPTATADATHYRYIESWKGGFGVKTVNHDILLDVRDDVGYGRIYDNLNGAELVHFYPHATAGNRRVRFPVIVQLDQIQEYTGGAGITADSCTLKDGNVLPYKVKQPDSVMGGAEIDLNTANSLTVTAADGVHFSHAIHVDSIEEKTAANGIVLDTSSGSVRIKDGIVNTDRITERTANAGVEIEGVRFEDTGSNTYEVDFGGVNAIAKFTGNGDVSAPFTLTADFYADLVTFKDEVQVDTALKVDTINENNTNAGVTIDGVLLKDGKVAKGKTVLRNKRSNASPAGTGAYEDIDTYTMPAGTLGTNDDTIEGHAHITKANNGNTIDIQIRLNDVVIADGTYTAAGGIGIDFDFRVQRTGATTGKVRSLNLYGASSVYQRGETDFDHTWANALDFTVELKCTTTNTDAVVKDVQYVFVPAVP